MNHNEIKSFLEGPICNFYEINLIAKIKNLPVTVITREGEKESSTARNGRTGNKYLKHLFFTKRKKKEKKRGKFLKHDVKLGGKHTYTRQLEMPAQEQQKRNIRTIYSNRVACTNQHG